jgi:hypothetical protein
VNVREARIAVLEDPQTTKEEKWLMLVMLAYLHEVTWPQALDYAEKLGLGDAKFDNQILYERVKLEMGEYA